MAIVLLPLPAVSSICLKFSLLSPPPVTEMAKARLFHRGLFCSLLAWSMTRRRLQLPDLIAGDVSGTGNSFTSPHASPRQFATLYEYGLLRQKSFVPSHRSDRGHEL